MNPKIEKIIEYLGTHAVEDGIIANTLLQGGRSLYFLSQGDEKKAISTLVGGALINLAMYSPKLYWNARDGLKNYMKYRQIKKFRKGKISLRELEDRIIMHD